MFVQHSFLYSISWQENSPSASANTNPQTQSEAVPLSWGFKARVSMVAFGSVPQRRGQLCSLLRPRPGPEERVLLLGLSDSSKVKWHKHSQLQGHTGPVPRSGPGRLSGSTASQAALTTHQRAPRSLSHSSRGPYAEVGSPEAEPAGAEPRGGRTDRPTDRRMSE